MAQKKQLFIIVRTRKLRRLYYIWKNFKLRTLTASLYGNWWATRDAKDIFRF